MDNRIKLKVIEFMNSDLKDNKNITYIKYVITLIKDLDNKKLLNKIEFIQFNK
jgi:hypothetical protein